MMEKEVHDLQGSKEIGRRRRSKGTTKMSAAFRCQVPVTRIRKRSRWILRLNGHGRMSSAGRPSQREGEAIGAMALEGKSRREIAENQTIRRGGAADQTEGEET
jgi:hypothetical protein